MQNKKEYIEEYININGIKEYLLHYPAGKDKPVLLYLHGGPGLSEAYFAYLLNDKIGGLCTFATYDQRGAGKTLACNKKVNMGLENFLQDLHETVLYLKKQYNKDRIILLGHSWGSVLGAFYVQKHPELIIKYVGIGQAVDMFESEKIACNAVKQELTKNGSRCGLLKLKKIGEYPQKPFDKKNQKKLVALQKLKQKCGFVFNPKTSLLKLVRESPVFKLKDFFYTVKGQKENRFLFKQVMEEFNLFNENINYQMPVYYIFGEKDYITPLSLGKSYFNKISAPKKKLFVMPNVSHNPLLEKPKEFANILREILDDKV